MTWLGCRIPGLVRDRPLPGGVAADRPAPGRPAGSFLARRRRHLPGTDLAQPACLPRHRGAAGRNRIAAWRRGADGLRPGRRAGLVRLLLRPGLRRPAADAAVRPPGRVALARCRRRRDHVAARLLAGRRLLRRRAACTRLPASLWSSATSARHRRGPGGGSREPVRALRLSRADLRQLRRRHADHAVRRVRGPSRLAGAGPVRDPGWRVGNFLPPRRGSSACARSASRSSPAGPNGPAQVAKVRAQLDRWEVPVILGVRFLPGIATAGLIAVALSGISAVRFLVLNAIAAVLWATSFGMLGYLLGNSVELLLGEVERYEKPIALVLLVITAGLDRLPSVAALGSAKPRRTQHTSLARVEPMSAADAQPLRRRSAISASSARSRSASAGSSAAASSRPSASPAPRRRVPPGSRSCSAACWPCSRPTPMSG